VVFSFPEVNQINLIYLENLKTKKDEVMAALASNKGSMIFASAIEIKKKMPDLNFKLFPSSIKQFVPTRGTNPSMGSKLCFLCVNETQSRHTR
jgi:hypothetical protein